MPPVSAGTGWPCPLCARRLSVSTAARPAAFSSVRGGEVRTSASAHANKGQRNSVAAVRRWPGFRPAGEGAEKSDEDHLTPVVAGEHRRRGGRGLGGARHRGIRRGGRDVLPARRPG